MGSNGSNDTAGTLAPGVSQPSRLPYPSTSSTRSSDGSTGNTATTVVVVGDSASSPAARRSTSYQRHLHYSSDSDAATTYSVLAARSARCGVLCSVVAVGWRLMDWMSRMKWRRMVEARVCPL